VRNWYSSFAVRSAFIATAVAGLLQPHVALAQFGKAAHLLPRAGAPVRTALANPVPTTPIPAPPSTAGPIATPAPQGDQFLQQLDRAIEITSKRQLTANKHSPWQIFHCILAMRQESMLRLGNEKVNAIQWLSTTEPQFSNEPWLLLTPHGAKFHPYTKMYFFEGHPAQFLALLSQSNLPLDHKFHVQGKVVALSDLINNTKKEVNTAEEVTWVLWALQHYLNSDAVWQNQKNETWSIERLVQIEANAAVVGAPCGGNHRLFALTRTRDKYLNSGGQLRGVWVVADQKIKQHLEIARSLQNPDGTFSADFYKGPKHTTDVNSRFNTTGHTMEFLSIGLPAERLSEPWVRNAVWVLSNELVYHRDNAIDCGPLFHSLNALMLYRDRIRPKPSVPATGPLVPLVVQVPPAGVTPKLEPDSAAAPSPPTTTPETRSIAQKLVEAKTGTTEPQAVPAPVPDPIAIPDPITVPESKPVEPTTEPAAVPMPQATVSSAVAIPLRVDRLAKEILKIDPSKLAHVGEAAPIARDPESRIGPPRIGRRDRNSPSPAPPGLLPDHSAATPLKEFELPIIKLKLQPGSLVSDVNVPPHESGPDCGAEHRVPSLPSTPRGEVSAPPAQLDLADEPASALEPVNQ
jgi:hypothetical protein